MLQEDKELYEFGPFRLDVTEHTFSRSDGAKNGALPEKAFQTLCVLVRNSGRLLTKKALMNHVWPDSFVEENNLDKCIHAIRQVLGEKPGEQTFIETVRKHGYRFVADVSRVETVAEIHEKNSETSEARPNAPEKGSAASEVSAEIAYPPTYNTGKKTPSNPGLRILASAFAALLLGSAIVGYYLYFSGRTADDGRRSIAVLPIKPVNTAIRDEIYEIGIADALIHKLSSVKGFTVRPLSATRKYADIDQDPIAAGNEQQVDYVLASNYQLAAGKIRVISQLFNVATRQIEETYKSESNATDIFAMQDAIVVDIGDALLARFPATTGSPTARGTRNEEAYRLYLQGMYLYDKRSLANAKKAVELLEQAVQMDSQYALAWAGKAHAHRAVVNHSHYFDDGERETTVHEQYQRSIEAINKALALDENLAEAYSALCENRMYYEYDFAGAELACKRAVELNPDSSLAHQIYARYLNTRGRHDEAIAESKTAIDLEPASLFNQRVYGTCLYFARRYEESIAQFKRVISMEKNFSSAYLWLRFALEMQGNEPEIFEWFMKSPRMQGSDEETVRALQTTFQRSGWKGVLREQVNRFEKSDEAYFHIAGKHAQIGNMDKAFEFLNRSYQQRELWIANLQVDPRLDSIRDDPRYKVLVDRVESK